MAKLQHENIVRLIGISFENSRDLLILELMEGGDLLKYLRCCLISLGSTRTTGGKVVSYSSHLTGQERVILVLSSLIYIDKNDLPSWA